MKLIFPGEGSPGSLGDLVGSGVVVREGLPEASLKWLGVSAKYIAPINTGCCCPDPSFGAFIPAVPQSHPQAGLLPA